SLRPIALSIESRWLLTSAASSGGSLPVVRYVVQASVVMVNPGGTGRPRLVISARLAPLPPSRSLRSLFPSAKSYTYLVFVPTTFASLRPRHVRRACEPDISFSGVRGCSAVRSQLRPYPCPARP